MNAKQALISLVAKLDPQDEMFGLAMDAMWAVDEEIHSSVSKTALETGEDALNELVDTLTYDRPDLSELLEPIRKRRAELDLPDWG